MQRAGVAEPRTSRKAYLCGREEGWWGGGGTVGSRGEQGVSTSLVEEIFFSIYRVCVCMYVD